MLLSADSLTRIGRETIDGNPVWGESDATTAMGVLFTRACLAHVLRVEWEDPAIAVGGRRRRGTVEGGSTRSQ
jgi:hypothetical protein